MASGAAAYKVLGALHPLRALPTYFLCKESKQRNF